MKKEFDRDMARHILEEKVSNKNTHHCDVILMFWIAGAKVAD